MFGDETGHGSDVPVWKTDGGEEKSLHLWEGSREVMQLSYPRWFQQTIKHPLSWFFNKAFYFSCRMFAANPSLSERSVHVLLERGLVQVEGGAPSHSSSFGLFCLLWPLILEQTWLTLNMFLTQCIYLLKVWRLPETFVLIWWVFA